MSITESSLAQRVEALVGDLSNVQIVGDGLRDRD